MLKSMLNWPFKGLKKKEYTHVIKINEIKTRLYKKESYWFYWITFGDGEDHAFGKMLAVKGNNNLKKNYYNLRLSRLDNFSDEKLISLLRG